ncbi:MAG: inositol-3-phosphate synthase [Myxococcales bacterium]
MVTKSKPDGKLAILMPGLGAVATTFMAGVELARKGKCPAIGSVTQLGTARIGKRDEHKYVKINELVPLATLDDLVFGAWDIIPETAAEVAERSGVLNRQHLEEIKPFFSTIKPKKAVYAANLVKNIKGTHFKDLKTTREKIEALRQDIRDFKKEDSAPSARW